MGKLRLLVTIYWTVEHQVHHLATGWLVCLNISDVCDFICALHI